jgi:hypothetical protein
MRFEQQVPGKGGVAVVSETGILTRLGRLVSSAWSLNLSSSEPTIVHTI